MVVATIITSILAAAGAIIPVALQYDAQTQAIESAEQAYAAQSIPDEPVSTWAPSQMGQYAATGAGFVSDAPDIISDNKEWLAAGLGAAAIAGLLFMVSK